VLVNPLFNPDDEDDKRTPKKDAGYTLHHRKGRTIQPLDKDLRPTQYTPVIPQPNPTPTTGNNSKTDATPEPKRDAAVDFIRQKVAAYYEEEPDVRENLNDAVRPPVRLSKHQQYMETLSTSGKSLAEIQTEWHSYYQNLPDQEKHEVWNEFYQANSQQPSAYTSYVAQQSVQKKSDQPAVTPAKETKEVKDTDQADEKTPGSGVPKAVVSDHLPSLNYEARQKRQRDRAKRSGGQIKQQILDKVNLSTNGQSRAKQQLQSLAFGLGTGIVVLVIFLFGFFNEVIIAPFVQPSRHVSATPIIVSSDSVSASETPEVIIPKINVQIPTVFDNTSVVEEDVQSALEKGVTHYPTTALPGQQGNTAFFGHSSNNIFNKGKYKFAFVLLHELVPGDVFYLTYNKVTYTYKVYDKRIVSPSEVSVLNNVPGKTATATLITCDPPGTSTNRLVVWGEQISPDPSGAPAATPSVNPNSDTTSPTNLPSEGPTLWGRFWNWVVH
jgi:LPXTG-site transpeptidase (sortase) family protein